MVRTVVALLVHLLAIPIVSETVDLGDRSTADLATFACRDINRSSILQRVCYDQERHRLIVAVKGRYDQYCGVPAELFETLMGAPSMGKLFNTRIRGSASGGGYDCRTAPAL
jgi:hypothetical protein